ncbi:hypothetical protein F5Y12DRAFT_656374 [Xylaria sp. FL1777]|nr:hypothetical protein F5Y12DRAFT_656374 [Xylaria sp. FL1777]
MSIGIQDLSDELVTRIANLLARRPEYGIAIPSRRWLQRQEEKINHLPKELLRPSSLKRLAIKIVDRIDPNIVDPQAVLCKTHSALNPFLIRRLFIALAYEVTVHTDSLRSWQGRALDPELSALVGRLDSIVALWTAPRLFHEIYGLAPFDGHHVFVKSGCEACCLAAVGASGRALADLRAALIDRMERRRDKPSGKKPRLYRVVEAWIDQLRKHRDTVDRPEQCRALSEALLVDLRMARPQIKAWRVEQKQHHAALRAAQRPVYAELRRTRTGAEIALLPPNAGHVRRTRNGIPVALVDIGGAEDQRRAAMSRDRRESIYRPDSLSGYSSVHDRQQAAYDPSTSAGPRPPAPEPVRVSGPSDGLPTESFLHRFEQEVSIHDDADRYNSEEEKELDEIDYIEESRAKVQDWWATQVSQSELDLSQDDAESMLSMVHPAFRPSASHIAVSALPTPLHFKKDREPRANQTRGRRNSAPSVWTDCTAYTADPNSTGPDTADIPPVPRIPSEYRQNGRPSPDGDITPETTRDSITSPSSSNTNSRDPPPNWPAPPRGHPPVTLENPRYQRLFIPNSDAGSTLSEQRNAFLMERFRPRGEDLQERDSLRTRPGTSTPAPSQTRRRTRPVSRASSSVYSRSSVASISSVVPSLGFSHESIAESELREGIRTPRQRDVVPGMTSPSTPVASEGRWRQGRATASEVDLEPPHESTSDARWTRHPNASSVTQINTFRGKM